MGPGRVQLAVGPAHASRACNVARDGRRGGVQRVPPPRPPYSQFLKGLPMSSGKRGSGAGHKTSAATGPGLDGGFNSRHRVGFSQLGLALAII